MYPIKVKDGDENFIKYIVKLLMFLYYKLTYI